MKLSPPGHRTMINPPSCRPPVTEQARRNRERRLKALLAIATIGLGACSPAVSTGSSEPDAVRKVEAGQVALVATAPDGTKLWAVKPDGGRTVYFSSRGTQTHHTEPCGKNCNRVLDDEVPAP